MVIYKEVKKKKEITDGLKHDGGKLRYDLVEPTTIESLAKVMTYGQEKGYKEHSWKNVKRERYIAAFYRHFIEYLKGNKTDDESGLEHLQHALFNIAAIEYIEREEKK